MCTGCIVQLSDRIVVSQNYQIIVLITDSNSVQVYYKVNRNHSTIPLNEVCELRYLIDRKIFREILVALLCLLFVSIYYLTEF
jgi:hypothetical protein